MLARYCEVLIVFCHLTGYSLLTYRTMRTLHRIFWYVPRRGLMRWFSLARNSHGFAHLCLLVAAMIEVTVVLLVAR